MRTIWIVLEEGVTGDRAGKATLGKVSFDQLSGWVGLKKCQLGSIEIRFCLLLVCVCVCACSYVHTHVHVDVSVFLNWCLPYLLKQGLLLNLGFTGWAGLIGWWAPKILCFPSLLLWNFRLLPLCRGLSGKYFTNLAMSLFYQYLHSLVLKYQTPPPPAQERLGRWYH